MVYSNLTNITGMLDLVQRVNSDLMFGWFGILILIAIGLILFTSFIAKENDIGKALTGTLFILFVLGLSLRALSLIPDLAIFVLLIGAALVIAVTWKR
jgi:hypothetical protein